MTDQPFDPFAIWRDMLTKWESGMNEAANRNMATPEFSRFMNQAMGTGMRVRHGVGEMMARYLETMNMPSRADIVALGERLHGIEEQIARLNVAVERLATSAPSAASNVAGPPRTKQPPRSLNGATPHVAETHAMPLAPPPRNAKTSKASKPARRRTKR